ncbi:DUF421 domain-containing protein [Blastococcus sp. VKM Ac-2987]|uniref:DUF421 domain-containing protein n=1 Tax=Blastococcus sp. VKM Ac-2987 TaxID=3004141 RepID=UPI0022AB85D2|nr:hypothetical protein [Blastococcus sp. VKM Ac-2987]MCZ2860140.1 hypothetical protein [Blastococcus sp. VKM Ac-2987]
MNQTRFFWDDDNPVARILLIGTLGYIALALLLRVSGARTMARMTPFDFVITVTLGSAFGRVLTASEVSLVEALVTFALLVVLQWVFAYGRFHWSWFARAVDPGPTLVWHDGAPVRGALARHRISESDLDSAAREKGFGSLDSVAAIVLQADGRWAVVGKEGFGNGSTVPAPAGR